MRVLLNALAVLMALTLPPIFAVDAMKGRFLHRRTQRADAACKHLQKTIAYACYQA